MGLDQLNRLIVFSSSQLYVFHLLDILIIGLLRRPYRGGVHCGSRGSWVMQEGNWKFYQIALFGQNRICDAEQKRRRV